MSVSTRDDLHLDATPSVDTAGWTGLVDSDPAATVFHDPVWVRAFAHALPYAEPWFLTARDGAGRLVGGIPAVRSTRMGLTQLLAQPYGTYGTPLVHPEAGPGILEALARAWREETRRPGVVRAHLVGSPGDPPERGLARFLPASWRRVESTYHIDPGGHAATYWESLPTRVRGACRKAEKLGVQAGRDDTERGLTALQTLYRRNAGSWSRHTPLPDALFRYLFEHAGETTEIWTARVETDIQAASLVLRRRDAAISWIRVLSPEGRRTQAGVLLNVRAIQEAAGRGVTRWCEGGGHSPALDFYKESLGGVRVSCESHLYESKWFTPLHRTYYRLTGKA